METCENGKQAGEIRSCDAQRPAVDVPETAHRLLKAHPDWDAWVESGDDGDRPRGPRWEAFHWTQWCGSSSCQRWHRSFERHFLRSAVPCRSPETGDRHCAERESLPRPSDTQASPSVGRGSPLPPAIPPWNNSWPTKLTTSFSLKEILSLRGICNCSGHCNGNTIVKFAILMYNSMYSVYLC